MFFVYVAISTVLYVGGDVLGKVWALNNNWWYFWVGLFLYALGGAAAFYSIKEESLSLALLILAPLAISISMLAGRFLFDEKISVVQYSAGAVILAAVVILMWNPKL